MDKYEYHVRLEQIHQHIAEKNYKSAAEIADTIDWRKVRSVRTLCTISDVYKMARRYEDSSALLELAYDKRPGSKPIVYALCEISLKNNDLLRAMKYFNIFSQIAPDDYRRLILQYLIYRAQDGTKEGQIQILEELKERELIERWCYELAELYHEVGFNTKCVEECDEIATWFAGGKYCRKALELKRLIEPLTPKQQALYDGNVGYEEEFGETKVIKDLGTAMTRENEGAVAGPEPTQEFTSREMDQIQVQTLDVNSGFNTMDIQRELAESLSEILEPVEANPAVDNPLAAADRREAFDLSKWQQEPAETDIYAENAEEEEVEPLPGYAPEYADEIPAEAEEAEQEEIAEFEEAAEIEAEPEYPEEYTEEAAEFTADEMYGETAETETFEAAEETVSVAEVPVTVGDMTELSSSKVLADLGATQGLPSIPDAEDVYFDDPNTQDLSDVIKEIGKTETKLTDHRNDAMEQMRKAAAKEKDPEPVELSDNVQNGIRRVVLPENPEGGFVRAGVAAAQFAGQKTEYDDMLTMESGGQIGLIVPEKQAIEKQITGQMSIEDILNEWEQVKKEQEKSLEEKVKNRVKKHTGELFEEYDEAAKEDLLEKLSTAAVAAEEEEARRAMEQEGFTDEVEETYEDEAEEAYAEETAGAAESASEGAESETAEVSEAETEQSEAEEPAKAERKPVKKKAPAKRQAKQPVKQPSAPLPDRTLTAEEKELFDSYIQSRRTRGQLIHTLEKMSMAAYTGNVIVTGERDAGTVDFAQNLIKMMRIQDGNFSGKAGKIDGAAMNKKDPEALFDKLKNGALIIDNAGALNCETAEKINRALQNEERGILLLLVDGRKSMDALLQINDFLTEAFDTRVDIEALNDKKLVEYGRRYAYEKEYAIDELGALALHTRIENLQTMDHAVTVGEVREIVRGAIQHANRKNLAHFCDVLFGRRYDEEDMVVLRENDFLVDV